MLIESVQSGNVAGDGLKCLANNCEEMNAQTARLGADHFQLRGTTYRIADLLQDNKIAALLDFDKYLHGKMSFCRLFQVMVMNRKKDKLIKPALLSQNNFEICLNFFEFIGQYFIMANETYFITIQASLSAGRKYLPKKDFETLFLIKTNALEPLRLPYERKPLIDTWIVPQGAKVMGELYDYGQK